MTAYRLATGGLVDRDRPVGFSFDGKRMQGYEGDTLASALLADGQTLVGRSFKYHRPRGILTAGAAEPNALVTLGRDGRTEANCRATMVELHEGLEARSQNCWPSLTHDIGTVNQLAAPFLGAGFYYKTFMWPGAFWEKVYEPAIRRAAGLGRASYEADPDRYEKAWAHCDLLVIGSGPTGLAAALTAARAGARVILADEQSRMGGSLLSESGEIYGTTAPAFAEACLAELSSLDNVTLMPRSTVFGWYDDNVFGVVERVQKHTAAPDPNRPVERLWRVAAKQAVLATGAEERPLVFGGNDRPGVMMAGAMRSYANRYGVAAGERVAVFTNGLSGYRTAHDLERLGVEVAAIVDPHETRIAYEGKARLMRDAVVTETKGGKALSSIEVRQGGKSETITVDALAMSGGWSPVIHLACHRGARPVWSEAHAAFLAPDGLKGLVVAGAAAGRATTETCLADGEAHTQEILQALGFSTTAPAFGQPHEDDEKAAPSFWYVANSSGKAFVDFQNDVHLKDLQLATREGYGHVEHAKRYTTNGMATDQGKLSNVNAIGILAGERGVSPGEIGTTTFRPFYTPVSFGAFAGAHRAEHFQPVRHSPLHQWAKKRDAVFVETGQWYRSQYFPQSGETHWRESVDREAKAVRSSVGLCDVSTLGKIEITGADAAEFLNRVYCNAFLKLPVGKARYGIMLREDGFIYDDGTTSRLGDNHFFMTTTTALAAGVLAHLEFCAQALWPELDVHLASATDQWAQMAIAGPCARKVLEQIVDEDISNEAFPFLAVREVTLFGGALRGRLFRISFSGELAFELAMPAGFGEPVAERLMEAGAPFGITPYGTEALGVLRIEKGHVTHAEIDGRVTPGDLGMGRMVSAKKPDFIGRAMLRREGLTDPDRPQLVGLTPLDPSESFGSGTHIFNPDDTPNMGSDLGHVTSTCFSPHLGHTIGLALVKHGSERHGEEVIVWNGVKKETTRALLCAPVFVDPENERLHV
ncbi:sarcosine oxidase subunit alpha family protein [Parvibaculum sp. MBR-TMA-1.3b-4.2]|jgi:sarcosine oxidase subunit alpha